MHLVQTWRQLWRVLEISDVVLLITDVRHPVSWGPTIIHVLILQQFISAFHAIPSPHSISSHLGSAFYTVPYLLYTMDCIVETLSFGHISTFLTNEIVSIFTCKLNWMVDWWEGLAISTEELIFHAGQLSPYSILTFHMIPGPALLSSAVQACGGGS